MTIGQTVEYEGRSYRCRGFAPLGVRCEQVELEDLGTGEWITVPLSRLDAEDVVPPEAVAGPAAG
jgi:hypothetical protein